ncbi:MAG: PQQ-dependent sugar dehydrogenase [Pseudomonadales bacterium]|nr:PQQ-dependent sugar dehydrogenase [Pseudomonadales bacterium]
MIRKSLITMGLLLSLVTSHSALANKVTEFDSEGVSLEVEMVASGFRIPWALAFLNDYQMLITERPGSLKMLDLRQSRVSTITGLPKIWSQGQGGLLDVAVKEPYQDGDWIYFTYSKPLKRGAATTLARAKLSENQLMNWQDLLVTQSAGSSSRHFGSRIAFVDDSIFFTVGDRGDRPNGQRLDTHAAKVLRVDMLGKAKADNPFVNDKKALPEIWSYGHRNPQGIVYDAKTKRLWTIEHGPRGGDEINLTKPGLNYGWPVVSHGKEYWGPMSVGEATEKPGMENPKKVYIPSIAPSSLLLYTGTKIPIWQGDLFAGALVLTHLNRVSLDDQGNVIKEERLLENLDERVRDVIQGPDEYIYLATDSGYIYRIRPK